jgi:hypothetical protein
MIRYFFECCFILSYIYNFVINCSTLFNFKIDYFCLLPCHQLDGFTKSTKKYLYFTLLKASILIIQSGNGFDFVFVTKYQPTFFFRIELCASLLIQLEFHQDLLYNKNVQMHYPLQKVLLLSTENVNLDFLRHAFLNHPSNLHRNTNE